MLKSVCLAFERHILQYLRGNYCFYQSLDLIANVQILFLGGKQKSSRVYFTYALALQDCWIYTDSLVHGPLARDTCPYLGGHYSLGPNSLLELTFDVTYFSGFEFLLHFWYVEISLFGSGIILRY